MGGARTLAAQLPGPHWQREAPGVGVTKAAAQRAQAGGQRDVADNRDYLHGIFGGQQLPAARGPHPSPHPHALDPGGRQPTQEPKRG